MKYLLSGILLFYSFVILSFSGKVEKNKIAAEDVTVYVYAFERIKSGNNEPDTYMFTAIYPITVDKELMSARRGADALEARLKNYIAGEMGDVLYSKKPCNCLNYFETKNKAAHARLQEIASHRKQGYTIMDAPFSFSFRWDWKENTK